MRSVVCVLLTVLLSVSAAEARVPLPKPRPTIVQMNTPQTCLASAVYKEARGESQLGQLTVAWVVRYRALLGLPEYGGTSVCGAVLKQTKVGSKVTRQISGIKNGNAWVPEEPDAWRRAMLYAAEVLAGRYVPTGELRYATHYLSPVDASVEGRCWFVRSLIPIEIVGVHVFYREPLEREKTWLTAQKPPTECQQKKQQIAAK